MTRLCRLFRGHAGGVLRVAAPAGECASEAGPGSARRHACDLRGQWWTYGSPRIQRALQARGHRVSRPSGGAADAPGRTCGRAWSRASIGRKAGVHRWFSRQPNHVRRTHATRPNQIWVGDVTHLGVGGRWWYLVVVLDQCSRRVLAWRLAATRDSRVTRAVLTRPFAVGAQTPA